MAIRRSHKKRRSHAKRRSYKKRHCKGGGAGTHVTNYRTFRVYGEAFENPEQDGRGAPFFVTVNVPFNSTVRELFRAVHGRRMHRMHQDLPFELRVGNEHGEPILINDVNIANIVGNVLWMVNIQEPAHAHNPNYTPAVFRVPHPFQYHQ